jgi:hypothetical protein
MAVSLRSAAIRPHATAPATVVVAVTPEAAAVIDRRHGTRSLRDQQEKPRYLMRPGASLVQP